MAAIVSASDLRSRNRCPMQLKTRIFYITNSVASAIWTQTRDISLTGVGLLCDDLMYKGDHFVLPIALEGQTNMVLCEVKYCRRVASGQYSVGASFVASQRCTKGEEVIPVKWIDAVGAEI